MLAMGAAQSAPSMRCPAREEPPESERRKPESERRRVERRPPVDERLIAPESRYEAVDGNVIYAAPADEPHGTAHLDLAAVLRAHVTAGYRGAVDMLTRTREVSDHAPDASIFPQERDAATGGRKLEELAFEIVSKQSMSIPTAKARDLVERGVRRVFCIDVGKRRVLEWSREANDWQELPPGATITDPCLVRPLPVSVLLDATAVDDELAEALLAKKNARLQAALSTAASTAASLASAAALAESVLRVLDARSVALSQPDRARVRACTDTDQLATWLSRAAVATRREDVFDQ